MSNRSAKHKVVVIGGGFGGLWTVKNLRKAPVEITLVDRRNFHLFQPLLYQAATGALSPADIASPLRGVFARQKNAEVVLDELTNVDLDKQLAVLRNRTVHYDTLIVATGSENHYYGHDDWLKYAPGLKTVEDALDIRRRIYLAFEAAENESDSKKRSELLTFVIIGGGPTGIELAGAIAEIARMTLKGNFKFINPADAKILVLEGGPRILASFPTSLAGAANRSLTKLGVEIKTGLFATEIDKTGVTVKEQDSTYRINARTVVWAAGVKPSPVANLLAPGKDNLDKAGRVIVNPDLSLPAHDNVFVIGDLAHCVDSTGRLVPGTAPVAMSQGRYVAKLIKNRLRGKTTPAYRYRDKGNMAVIGRAAAIADLGWARFSGYPAWLLWLFIHLMYLVEYDNRVLVFINWAWNYFTRNKGARLITETNHRSSS